jgi:hypothetical protein
MLNLREAYYKPFEEEARPKTSVGLEFNHDDYSGTATAQGGDIMDISHEESTFER